jgi:hypothetical protein
MEVVMKETTRPQINISKIRFGGGIAGAVFTIGSMLIFLTGLPALKYFLLAAIAIGCGVAGVIHFAPHETPGKPWLDSTK